MSDKPHCNNGCCKKPVYIGKECFRCWAGTKFDSIMQRVRNRNGNYPTYEGLRVLFTRRSFIRWAENNRPDNFKRPSLDRIVPSLGYIPENVRWIEVGKNSSGAQRDIPDGFYLCKPCGRILPLSCFGKHNGKRYGKPKQTYCKECKLSYDRQWRKEKLR